MKHHLRMAPVIGACLFLFPATLLGAAPYTGQPYDTSMYGPRAKEMIFAAPSQPDFLFDQGDEIAIDCHPVARALRLTWTLHRNLIKKPLRTGTVEVAVNNRFPIRIPTAGLEPGFYDLRVEVFLTDRERVKGITVFGWQPEKQPRFAVKPDDFDAFWEEARKKVAAVDLKMTRAPYATFAGKAIGKYNRERASLPEHPDPAGETFQTVEVFKVTFQSVGATIHAWFAKPPGPGPFPGLLILPGAGNRYRPIPLEAARHGYAALDLQVHGEPVDWPNARYSPLPKEDPKTPEGLLYYSLVLHALQGVNALLAQEEVDPKRIAVEGSSQGGYLTVAVAAQDRRIKAGVATLTYMANRPYHYWAQQVNRKKGDGATLDFDALKEPAGRFASECYLDALHFAPQVRCPLFLNAGLIDTVSPPSTVYAVYQALQGTKVFVPMPNTSHDVSFACDRQAWRWLEKQLQ